jgi:hypothetical protein
LLNMKGLFLDFYLLLIVLWTFLCKYLNEYTLFHLGRYLEVKLLGHVAVLGLSF